MSARSGRPAEGPSPSRPAEAGKPKRVFTPQHLAALRAAHAARRGKPIKVTKTPKRLAAARENLKKAWLASRQRPPQYEWTPARAWALRKATEAARASPRSRGHGFRHGLHAPLLAETLVRAGEDPAEFEAHVERFVRAFGPASFTPEAQRRRERQTEDFTAETPRGRENSDHAGPSRESAHPRPREKGVPAFAGTTGNKELGTTGPRDEVVTGENDIEVQRLARAAAETAWRRLRAYRGWSRWERAKLARRLQLAVEKSSFHPAEARLLALDGMDVLRSDWRLNRHVERLDRRLEDLLRALGSERFGHEPPLRRFRPRRRKEPAFEGRAIEVMNNPLRAPVVIQSRLLEKLLTTETRSQRERQGASGLPAAGGQEESRRLAQERAEAESRAPDWPRLFRAALVPPGMRGERQLEEALAAACEALEARLDLYAARAAQERAGFRAALGELAELAPFDEEDFTEAADILLRGLAEGELEVLELAAEAEERFQAALVELARAVHGKSWSLQPTRRRERREEERAAVARGAAG